MPATAKPTRPLTCHKCGATTGLSIAGAGNSRRIRGKKRRTTHVRCRSCGNEWDSTHPTALKEARAVDAAAGGGR